MTEYSSKKPIPVKDFISFFNNLASTPKEDVLIDTLILLIQNNESLFSLIDDPYLNAIKNLKLPENVVLNEKLASILEFFYFYEGDSKDWYSREFQKIEQINKEQFDKIKLGKFAKDSYPHFTQILNIMEFIDEIYDNIYQMVTSHVIFHKYAAAAEDEGVDQTDVDTTSYLFRANVEDALPQINIELYQGQLIVNTKSEDIESINQRYIEKTYRYGTKNDESISHINIIELKGPKLHLLLKEHTIISYLTKIFDFDNFNFSNIYFYYGPSTLEVLLSPSELKLTLISESNIWLAQITIPQKYFEIYQCEKEIKLKIKWEDFQKLEGKSNNSKEIRIILEETPEGHDFSIKVNNFKKKSYLFRSYDSDYSVYSENTVQNIKDVDCPIIVEFDSIKLKSLDSMSFVKTFFWEVSPDAQNLFIKAREPKRIKNVVLVEIPAQNLSVEKMDNLSFSRAMLKLLFKVVSPSEKIKIYLKERYPLIAEMELKKKGFILTYVQAPRLENQPSF